MPTLRKRISRYPVAEKITPETVALYKRCIEIMAEGKDEIFEADGGRRREFIDARLALHQGLGLKPWHYDVLWVAPDRPRHAWEDADRYTLAQELRQALHEVLEAEP